MLKNLFISKPENVYYLTGFTGSRGMVLLTKGKKYFFTDFRYIEYARNVVPNSFKVIQIDKQWKKDWPGLIKKLKIKNLGIEENFLTIHQFNELKKISKGVKLKNSLEAIENLREIKSNNEFELLKKSQQINEEILKIVTKKLKPGVTEKQIEWLILEQIHSSGADGPSFIPIVAFGDHSSIPHHQNTQRKLQKGDTVLLDMGVKYKHYCSDMTRTFFTSNPDKLLEKVYSTVLAAQKNAIKSLKPDVQNSKVNKAANDIIKKAGYLENFQHGLGHGVGLEIHESPNLAAEKPFRLKENMITTIEPGIYLKNHFGVRIEDMVKITRAGYENFTKAPKELKDIILKI